MHIIDCWLYNIQRQIFSASSGREYVQKYVIKRNKVSMKKRKETNMETAIRRENHETVFDCHQKNGGKVGCANLAFCNGTGPFFFEIYRRVLLRDSVAISQQVAPYGPRSGFPYNLTTLRTRIFYIRHPWTSWVAFWPEFV